MQMTGVFSWRSSYPNLPMFLDRYVCANSADLDQTTPRGAILSGTALCLLVLLCSKTFPFRFLSACNKY